ncbi:MAG: disulfide bond formation protein B [Methylococcales bacterium]|jgi:protein dithiol:quinone oxidoreductase|nr:disulfide bond formation protein B [Methylococcales bacterium]MBT7443960.1 disulfide bond formation protein B [Methylococcales bacterium]
MNQRWISFSGLMICIASMVFAIAYLEKTLNLDPCPLCMLDRAVITAIAVVFLLAWLHNPTGWGKRIYGLLTTLLIFTGIGISGRHIWIQNLPADQVPSCGADFDYMWDNWPLGEMIQTILKGSGDCADVVWQFLGLTIPEQVLLFMIGLLVLTYFAFRKTS